MIRVQSINACGKYSVRHKDIVKLVRIVLKNEGCPSAMVNVIFIDDQRMIELNSKYLHHRYPTDVISFLLTEKPSDLLEGEVYVNLDQAYRQAKEYNVTFTGEKARLVTHGVLHLAGYDDASHRQRQRMSRLEDKYLSTLASKHG